MLFDTWYHINRKQMFATLSCCNQGLPSAMQIIVPKFGVVRTLTFKFNE